MSRGLLGLLVVVVLLGGGAAIALGSLGGSGTVDLPPAVTTTVAPGASRSGPDGAPPVDRGALAVACTADAQSVESAVQLYQSQNGHLPPDLAALVPTWLRAPPGSGHYTISLDAQGHVGVFPPGSAPTGPVPAADDVGLHPELCSSVPR